VTTVAEHGNAKSPDAAAKLNVEALNKASGKLHPMLAVLADRIQDRPGNPYWLAFDAMTELTGKNPWRWESHWPQIVHEAARRERVRRGELSDVEAEGVEVSEVSTRQAHADQMLRVHVDGERAGTVLKDADGWRVFGDPCTYYGSRGDAVDALVAGRRALIEAGAA